MELEGPAAEKSCVAASLTGRIRLSYETAKIMVFKMIEAAQKSWRKLDGQNQLPKVIEGIKFNDGIEERPDHAAA